MKTRLLGFLGISLLVGFAAACGGDDGNNSGTCGDGHVTGAETCDDGNTASGDGCSSTCHTETTCGNGVVEVSTETCDDGNTVNGDGCSSTCQTESGTCGNGIIEGSEGCDDGNTTSSDGCSGTCAVENGYTCTGQPSMCTMGGGGANTCSMPGTVTLTAMGNDLVGEVTGDTTGGTSMLAEAECDGFDSGAGNDQIWKFTTTDVRDVLVVLTPSDTFDGAIRLMRAACDSTMEVVDQVGGDGCSDSGYEGDYEVLGYVNLPAGTYYVAVDSWATDVFGSYTLDIKASVPSCGDGQLGDVEFCDDGNMTDGDGCTHCTVDSGWNCNTAEPSVCQAEGCGDGLIQTGEECDDDNTDPNDGCSATCTVESGYTCDDAEPSVCTTIACGNGIVQTGEACDDGDMDPNDGCSATCTVESGWTCTTASPSVCTMIVCGNGLVEGSEECDDGNTVNGDRCSSTCVLEQDYTEANDATNNTIPEMLSAGSHIIRGTFSDTDVDLYSFTLTATSTVEIETYATIDGNLTNYSGDGNHLNFDCPTTTYDTQLALFPAGATVTDNMMALAVDDDDGDLFCSYLGGANDTSLMTLPAGTYTIRLRKSESMLADTIPTGTRYMIDLAITQMGGGPVAPAAGDLVINEFLAADGPTLAGDSNCDGSATGTDDEFIELVNASNKTLDLTGVTIADSVAVRFTFAAQGTGSLTLAPGKAVVVWAGGTPNCPGVTDFFTNGTAHTLGLNDTGGDSITVATGGSSPVMIATTTYGDATVGTSFNLNPDITGTAYALHSAVTGAVGTFSPGKKADGTAF